MSKKLNLTGQRFGRLTVLRPAENIGDRTAWVCRCDCERETVVRTSCLRRGHTKSCGCAGGPLYARQNLTYVNGTCVEVLKSKKVRRNNTSGVPGVTWISRDQLWRATIFFKGKNYYLGGYQNFEDAVTARKEAERDLHDNFFREYVVHAQSANG